MTSRRLDLTYSGGTLDLVCADGADEYWFETLANGFGVGSPQAVKVIRQSLMRDGSDSYISRYDNRTITFAVAVNSADLLGVQLGEQALAFACAGRAQLSWTPPDGIGATTVYEVLNADFAPSVDDLQWVRPGKKQTVYTLTLECEPFGHSVDLRTVTFSPATPTITTLDAGSATTNFSVASGDAATITTTTHLAEASIKIDQTAAAMGYTFLRWSGAFTGTTYVAVDIAADPGNALVTPPTFGGNFPLATQMQAGGYMRYFYATPTSPADMRLTSYILDGTSALTDFYIGGIYGATSLPSTGVLSAQIEGSVRTNGTITISGGVGLGDVIVYADPTLTTHGWQPDDPTTWANAPEGTYAVWAKSLNTFGYSAGDLLDVTIGSQVAYTVAPYASTSDNWFPVGRIAFGGKRNGRIGSFTPTMHVNSAGTNRYSNFSVRLIRMSPDTSLTIAHDLTDTRLLIDLPSLDYPLGGVWGGAAGSESSVLDSCDAWDYPVLSAPSTDFFIRCSAVASPTVTATYYPRWHSFAGA